MLLYVILNFSFKIVVKNRLVIILKSNSFPSTASGSIIAVVDFQLGHALTMGRVMFKIQNCHFILVSVENFINDEAV